LKEKGVATLKKAVIMNPDSPVLANNLACYYLEENINLNKALSLAQSAYDRLHENPIVADILVVGCIIRKSSSVELFGCLKVPVQRS